MDSLFNSVLAFTIVICINAKLTDKQTNNELPELLLHQEPKEYKYPFLDPSLPWDDRVNDLVGRLTLDEVISQTSIAHGSHFSHTPEISRLGIGKYVWITECGRGQGNTYGTAFPQSLGLAAAFRYLNILYDLLYTR